MRERNAAGIGERSREAQEVNRRVTKGVTRANERERERERDTHKGEGE